MAKTDKPAETKSKPEKKIETKEFTLKKPLGNKAAGDKIKLGPKGEEFYSFNGTI